MKCDCGHPESSHLYHVAKCNKCPCVHFVHANKDPNDRFELLAKEFYNRTGLIAPGKDHPAVWSQDRIETEMAWREFLLRKNEYEKIRRGSPR